MKITIPADVLNEIANLLAMTDAGKVYKEYSGRGMFGDTCFGITINRYFGSQFKLAMMLMGEEMIQTHMLEHPTQWACCSWDNMGLDTIIYFPELVCDPEWEEDVEDE